jgi:hypothetical protein
MSAPGNSYDWTVPDVGVRTTGYLFKVTAYDALMNNLGEDASDASFAINP